MVLAACGGGGGEPAATEPAASGAKVTSSGFACPGAKSAHGSDLEGAEPLCVDGILPADMLECFELVYGVKVNRDEYSSNEEMYAKLSAGGTAYDLVQPTDYIVAVDDPPGTCCRNWIIPNCQT